jgi:hypothetical protein
MSHRIRDTLGKIFSPTRRTETPTPSSPPPSASSSRTSSGDTPPLRRSSGSKSLGPQGSVQFSTPQYRNRTAPPPARSEKHPNALSAGPEGTGQAREKSPRPAGRGREDSFRSTSSSTSQKPPAHVSRRGSIATGPSVKGMAASIEARHTDSQAPAPRHRSRLSSSPGLPLTKENLDDLSRKLEDGIKARRDGGAPRDAGLPRQDSFASTSSSLSTQPPPYSPRHGSAASETAMEARVAALQAEYKTPTAFAAQNHNPDALPAQIEVVGKDGRRSSVHVGVHDTRNPGFRPVAEKEKEKEKEKAPDLRQPPAQGASGNVKTLPFIKKAAPSKLSKAWHGMKSSAADAIRGPRPPAGPTTTPSREIAAMDLTAGLALSKRVQADLPAMSASITFEDPKALAAKPGSKEELVMQRMTLVAYSALNEAKTEIKAAIEDYDRSLKDRGGPHDSAVFKGTCKAILQAQQARVNQLVQNEWAMEQHRDSNLSKTNLKFGVKLGFKTGKLALSATSIGFDPTGLSIAAATVTSLQIIELLGQHLKSRESALKSILKNDASLNQQLRAYQDGQGQEPTKAPGGFGRKVVGVGKELVASTHLPFVNKAIEKTLGQTVHAQEDALNGFLAKSAKFDEDARTGYQQASAILEAMDQQIKSGEKGPAEMAHLETTRNEVAKLLDKLFSLTEQKTQDDQTYQDLMANCEDYRRLQPAHTKGASHTVGHAALGADLAYIGVTLAKLSEYAV